MNAISTKVVLRLFPPVCPFICPVYFHLVTPRRIFSPCYARYVHIREYKGVCNILVSMLRLQVPKHAILNEVVSAKHAWVSLDKIWMGQMGKLEVKNSSTTFVLTAFISFGLFNNFQTGVSHRSYRLFGAGFVV